MINCWMNIIENESVNELQKANPLSIYLHHISTIATLIVEIFSVDIQADERPICPFIDIVPRR